jgi:hypothetical protein
MAAVLVLRGVATPTERALYNAHRPRSPVRPQAPLTADSWSSLLLHPEEDRLAGEIFGVIASAALLGRLSALRRDPMAPTARPGETPGHGDLRR